MSKTLHFSMGNIHLKALLYKKMGVPSYVERETTVVKSWMTLNLQTVALSDWLHYMSSSFLLVVNKAGDFICDFGP